MGNVRSAIQNYSFHPIERLRVLDRLKDAHLDELRLGALFVLACWSSPAIMGLKRFTRVMSLFSRSPVEFLVIDFDSLSHKEIDQLFGTPGFPAGGNGETIWVKDGSIVAREIAAPENSEALLYQHTSELLIT